VFERFERWLVAMLLLLVTGRDSLCAARPAASGVAAPLRFVLDLVGEPLLAAPSSVSQIPTCVLGVRVTIQSRNVRHDEISRRPRASCYRG